MRKLSQQSLYYRIKKSAERITRREVSSLGLSIEFPQRGTLRPVHKYLLLSFIIAQLWYT